MNIKRAKEEIKDTIAAYLQKDEFGNYEIPSIRQRPLLLIGPPGVGKTQIMEQISRECQIGLVAYTITHHTRQSAIGLPFIERKQYGGKEYAVTEYTMSEIVASVYDKIEQTGMPEGILFIDEINCVSETLAPTMLQFLQGKSFGAHKIPEGWVIVAAGNPPEYNKSVREFDIVTLDRIRMIVVEPDLNAWKEYAELADIHPAVRSYLNIKVQNFSQIETTVDGKLFATPRGWEDLSELIKIYEKLQKTVDRDVVSEYIQFPKIAKDFANYLELYYKYEDDYQVVRILEGEIPAGVADKLSRAAFDERISVVGLLLSGLGNHFRAVWQQEAVLDQLMEQLRQVHGQPEFQRDPLTALSLAAEVFEREREKKQERGLLSRADRKLSLAAEAKLEGYLKILREEGVTGDPEQNRDCAGDTTWERIRELFGADSDCYEALAAQGGRMLEYAFDFMEAVFAGSQEMVMFLTELNTGFYSVHFLQQYDCERYYQYNKNLMFDDQEQGILKDMGRQDR